MLLKSKDYETAMQKSCKDHVTSFKYRTNCKTWRHVDAKKAVLGFLVLNEHDVRQITFGVYEIKQAYLKNGQYHINVSEMESYHTSKTLYNLWIKYSPSTICG